MRHSSALSRGASPADSHDESTRAPEWREPPAHESHSALSDRTLMPVLVVCELDHSVEALARDPDDRTGHQAAAATSRGDRGTEQGRGSCLTPTGGCQRLPAFTGELGLDLEIDREHDGRWLAEVPGLPGVMCYGRDRDEAIARVQALALRVIAERLEHREAPAEFLNVTFQAA